MIEKKRLLQILNQYKTPLYIFDLEELENRIINIKNMLNSKVNLCYAMKANPFLVSYMQNIIDKYEVCSPGELDICAMENINLQKVVLSGVNKLDIANIIKNYNNIGVYTIESISQLEDINAISTNLNLNIKVLLRLSSGNQFGMDKQTIEEIIINRHKYSNILISGIQYYSTTQKKEYSLIEKEISMLYDFCNNIKLTYNFSFSEIEYGPGLSINYFEPNSNNNYEELQQLSNFLNKIKDEYNITLEIGRFLAATCGLYVTTIVDVKKVNNQNYCIVDGGINHLNYYGQVFAMKIPKFDVIYKKPIDNNKLEKYNICGSLCTIQDVLLKNIELKTLEKEDLFVFYNVGAYSITESMYLFLSRNLPSIVLYDKNENTTCIRKNLPTSIINSKYLKFEKD